MAVPKKRTPKSRRNARRSKWFAKAFVQGQKALAFSKSWVPPTFDDEPELTNDTSTSNPTVND